MEESDNHTKNAEKFEGALDKDASIYQKREEKSAKESFSSLHGKEKRQFFIDYYLNRLIVVLALVVVAALFVINYVLTPDTALGVLAVNATGEVNEEYEQEYFSVFLGQNGIDDAKSEVNVNRSLNVDANSEDSLNSYSVDTIVTLFTAQDVDLFFADADFFLSMAMMGYLKDLEDCLTAEELAQIDEEDLIYATIQEDADPYGEVQKEQKTILAGIRLSQDYGFLADIGWYPNEFEVFVGLADSSKHEELGLTLLEDILS